MRHWPMAGGSRPRLRAERPGPRGDRMSRPERPCRGFRHCWPLPIGSPKPRGPSPGTRTGPAPAQPLLGLQQVTRRRRRSKGMPGSASIACSFKACSFRKNMSQRTIRSQAFLRNCWWGRFWPCCIARASSPKILCLSDRAMRGGGSKEFQPPTYRSSTGSRVSATTHSM
jgi:hypothetical protein